MNVILAIFAGGGIGAVIRHYAVVGTTRIFGDAFPYGTLAVNVIGSLLIGVIIEGVALKWDVSLEMRALMVTGFLGGFTTFSAFSLDFFRLFESGQMHQAFSYAVISVLLSLAAVFAGVYLTRGIMA